ncbi:hypothetical protein FS842_003873 [Serendipita sp. 407]|nr:hypothetical protein FS842_003873 [Serendipita sp. 407]
MLDSACNSGTTKHALDVSAARPLHRSRIFHLECRLEAYLWMTLSHSEYPNVRVVGQEEGGKEYNLARRKERERGDLGFYKSYQWFSGQIVYDPGCWLHNDRSRDQDSSGARNAREAPKQSERIDGLTERGRMGLYYDAAQARTAVQLNVGLAMRQPRDTTFAG